MIPNDIRKRPQWADAPDWANWLTMDDDGAWMWHEKNPQRHWESWFNNGKRAKAGNRWRKHDLNWQIMKEERPKNEVD